MADPVTPHLVVEDNLAMVEAVRALLRHEPENRPFAVVSREHLKAVVERLDDVSDEYQKKLDEANGEIEHLRVILDERDDQIRTMLDERRNYQTLLAARDESLQNIRDIHVRDCRFIERLERANSTLHQSLAEEQRERELLVASVANAMGELSEFFRQANALRGRGTPRSITHEPPRIAAVEA